MKKFLCAIIVLISCQLSSAETQDYIKCSIIYKSPNVVYFDVGSLVGVIPGEEFEIYYDERVVATGKIGWSDENISRSEEIESDKFVEIYYYDELSAKIRLYIAISNRGGFLTIPYFSDLNLDPSKIDTPADKMIGRLLHRGLLTRDDNGYIISDLASVYEIRGLTYTFYIDDNAVFHSGKPVEAVDVAYSFEKMARSAKLTPATSFVLAIRGAYEYRHRARNEIAGIFLIDKKSLSITLKEPFPAFEEYLAGPGGYIISKPGISTPGGNVNGAGPYKIKWRSPGSITLIPSNINSSEVYLDSLIFSRFANIEEAALSMELGNIDLIATLGEPPPKFISSASHSSLTANTFCSVILGFNGEREYQKESLLSRALSFLIDRESIVRVILGGAAALPEVPVPGFDKSSVRYNYALMPDSVDYYLNRIGKLPSKLILYTDSNYPSLSKVSRYIIGQLASKGIKVSEKVVDLSFTDETRIKSELDIYLTYYNPVSDNPDCALFPLYSYSLSGQSNYLYYKDDAFQSFLRSLRKETDPERRVVFSQGLAQSLANEPPAIVLYEPYLTIIFKNDIAGVMPVNEGYVDLRRVYIESNR